MKHRLTNRGKKESKGFTLIEILLSLSILSLIVGVSYGSMRQIIRAKKTLDDKRDSQIIANSILNRVSREFQLATGTALIQRPQEQSRKYSSDVHLLGEQAQTTEGTNRDSIRIMAMEAGQYLPDGQRQSGLVQLVYRMEEPPKEDNPPPGTYWLIREEIPAITPIEEAHEKMIIFPVAKNVTSLSFRYYNSQKEEWSQDWGTENNVGLPGQIEMRISLVSPLGIEDVFTTRVALRAVR